MNHIIIKTLIIGVILAAVVIPGYLYEIKAEAKTHSKSLSMSTSCNGPDEPCQTTVCEDNKPCRTVDSNSDQTDMTTACKDNKPCSNINPDVVKQEEDDNNDMTTPLEAP